MSIPALDEASYRRGLTELADAGRRSRPRPLRDSDHHPCGTANPGFPTLIHIILEQQVSLASARACFDKLLAAVGELTPESLLALDDGALKRSDSAARRPSTPGSWPTALIDGGLDLDGLADTSRRRGSRAVDAAQGHRSVDRGHLPSDGPRSTRCLAGRRSRTGGRGEANQEARCTTEPRGVPRTRRGMEAVAFGRGAAAVASLSFGGEVAATFPVPVPVPVPDEMISGSGKSRPGNADNRATSGCRV